MKRFTAILTLVATLVLAGCSKQGDAAAASSKKQRYVPQTVQAITASAEWKLDFTTKTGIQCYVKTVSEDVRKQLSQDPDHPDYEYLQEPSDKAQPAYFLVMVRNGSIYKDLKPQEAGEITGYVISHDKGFNDLLKKAGK